MSTDRTELPLASTSSCSCCSVPAQAEPKQTPASTAGTTLLVQGMTCAHCVASVTEELTELDGVEGVTIDLVVGGASAVTVSTSTPVSDEALRSAVQEAGYEVVSR
jgi:copper chaperone CopZ